MPVPGGEKGAGSLVREFSRYTRNKRRQRQKGKKSMIQPEEEQVRLRGEEITLEEKGGRRDRNKSLLWRDRKRR